MSDKGEKVCPLCTEEMDLTDQQLKPCNCGYEICVWCWHHVMEMAEKDNTEGRCPACRTPYDREKIVGMAGNCERLVAEINSERKQKSQKPKPKASEGKMHLTSVRVIQRNLVYIIGLPLNLADEELLQRRDYFGQYGKVLKVSISRTATGVIQHSANNSCCVYITYSKEEEAIRCIQSVHSFVLDGRCLRACFGTTKYCHAWLRNMPCSIPDCLYLHDFGSQEDSFTKDDLVSAFQRSKVQQIIGSTNNMHRPSGNVLPPPADQYTNSNIPSTGRPVAKNSSNQNIENQNKGSCADSDPGRSNALPAAASWVMRVSASLPPITNSSCSGGLPSSRPGTSDGPSVLASEAVSTNRSTHDVRTVLDEESCEVHPHCKLGPLELAEEYNDSSCHIALSNTNARAILDTSPAIVTASNQFPCLLASKGIDRDIAVPPMSTHFLERTKPSCSPGSDEAENVHADGDFQGLCSGLSSVSIHSHLKNECSVPVVPNSSVSSHILVNLPGSQGSQQDISQQFKEPSVSLQRREAMIPENLLDFDDGQLKGLEDICCLPTMSSSPCSLQNLNQSKYHSWQQGEVSNQSNPDAHPRVLPMKLDEFTFPKTSGNTVSSSGFSDNKANSFTDLDRTSFYSSVFSEVRLGNLDNCNNNIASVDNNVAPDTGESSIISKILSIDLDAWEDSLTSPQNLVKLLSDTDKQHGSLKIPSLRKVPDGKQSRFSFARQEDFFNQVSDMEHVANECSTSYDLDESKDFCMDKYENIFSSRSSVESDDNFLTFSKFSVSKTPNSTPPGFSVPCRTPPPGFPTHGRMQKAFDSSASHLLQTSALPSRTVSNSGDVEFVDPAILEVGKGMMPTGLNNPGLGMRPTSSAQLSPFDHDAGLQQLMHQSVSAHQNLRFPDRLNNRFSPTNETHSISPMLLDQFQPNYRSAFTQSTAQQVKNVQMSNGPWGLWNEVKSISELGMPELVAKGGLGLNRFVPSHEDLRSQMSSSSNLYNKGFAM